MISARDVTKTFRLRHERRSAVKDVLLHPLRSRSTSRFAALRDISLEIQRGEFVGVVGRNGGGKSTLLRCLAGIYPVHSGELKVRGRVAPFIDLGVGFNPELAARDNVLINAVMLGLTPREARRHFDEIIDFAELREFADVKLKNYSSGMIVRLAFAVTVHVTADVLLFDEVLAVGDAAFQQKCFDRFEQLKAERITVLLVTHEMSLVERFCDRALLLEDGEIIELGDPVTVARRYASVNAQRGARANGHARIERDDARDGIRAAWFEDDAGTEVEVVEQGAPCRACVEVAFAGGTEDPVLGLTIRDSSGRVAFATSSRWAHGPSGSYGPGQTLTARVRFANWLAPGRYTLSCTLSRDAGELLDERIDLVELTVFGPRSTGAAADLPHDFEFEAR